MRALLTRMLPLSRLSLVMLILGWLPMAASAGPLTDKGTQPGLNHPLLSAGDCDGCHGDFEPASHYEPWPTWSGSMMANSGRDPLFWAALDVANNDLPGAGDFCLRCHAPQGWLAGRSEPPGGSVDGCALEGKIDETNQDFDGITCHLCHRMMENPSPPPGEQSVYFENGQFWLDDTDCNGEGEPCRRGPYSYPADGSQPPPHAFAQSDYHENSDICGNCHNVTSPLHNLIDGGVDTGIPYPIERTFKEWQQSDFAIVGQEEARTCQNCHMPDRTQSPAYACDDGINNHPNDLPKHTFVGGNTWIPEVLRLEYPNLDRDQSFIETRDAARALLQTSASVALSVPTEVPAGGTLAFDATVTNHSGHKLPTGYPEGRRMWLHVEARDGLGALLWESGGYDSSSGTLTEDAQIKIYQAKPGVWQGGACQVEDGGAPQFHFVLNNCYAVDNRIPPLGFSGGSDLETQPVNYTYPETAPGSGTLVNYDVTTYSLPIPVDTPTPISVTATLRFQTVSKEYVEFLRDEALANGFPDDCIERSAGFPTQSRGEILYDMWNARGRSEPENVASAVGSVPVPEPGVPVALLVGGFGLLATTRARRSERP